MIAGVCAYLKQAGAQARRRPGRAALIVILPVEEGSAGDAIPLRKSAEHTFLLAFCLAPRRILALRLLSTVRERGHHHG